MLNLCDTGHDEVCFEGRNCPMCALQEALNEMTHTYESDINSLTAQIINMQVDLDEYKEIYNQVKKDYPEYTL